MSFNFHVETFPNNNDLHESLLEGGTYHTDQKGDNESDSKNNKLHQRTSSIIVNKTSSTPPLLASHHAYSKSSITFNSKATPSHSLESKHRIVPTLPPIILALPMLLIF